MEIATRDAVADRLVAPVLSLCFPAKYPSGKLTRSESSVEHTVSETVIGSRSRISSVTGRW